MVLRPIHIFALALALLVSGGCARDYSKALVGTWDTGPASENSRIIVVFNDDGSMQANLTNMDMKPIKGTYSVDGDELTIHFPASKTRLDYSILDAEKDLVRVKARYAKIDWKRIPKETETE